ncbi:hypothetical protein [Mariniradius saccharolyticus]|uniref:hypothetical protein n=1 Tax=Mariniradius saccharolyticus TaxID=1245591 RepID=UPI00058C9B85|nr:hypothetical protein [Mariniradius saccharolyticus]
MNSMKIKTIFALLIISTFGCQTTNVQKKLSELQNLQPPDFSQIKEPQLSEPKAQMENILMELYEADTAAITATGMFKYGTDSTVLINQWFRATFVNSKKITDATNEELSDNLAREIGIFLRARILNLEDYDKMEIIFINQTPTSTNVASGSIKQRIHLSIPELNFIN